MTDISEEEAILHLKRALGEIEPGDAVPRPLEPVVLPPPKVQKTVPRPVVEQPRPQVSFLSTRPAQEPSSAPMVGPSLPPSGGVQSLRPTPAAAAVAALGTQRPQGAAGISAPAGGVGLGGGASAAALNSLASSQKEAQLATTLQGLSGLQGLKGLPGGKRGPQQLGPGLPDLSGSGAGSGPAAGAGPAQPLHIGAPLLPGVPAGTGAAVLQGLPGGLGGKGAGVPGVPVATGTAGKPPPMPELLPGQTQVQFELPQSKVALVIGKGAATMNAVKTYSKANCFIEQRTPDEDKARVTVTGSPHEVEKCKQTLHALTDGTMSAATLFQLAGIPMPAGGVTQADSQPEHDRGPSRSPPVPSAAAVGLGAGAAGAAAALGHLGAGGGAAAAAAAVAANFMPQMGSGAVLPAHVPGMPEDARMQQNLNDYYARWWSTYATVGPEQNKVGEEPVEEPQAFDKEALARLAERAEEVAREAAEKEEAMKKAAEEAVAEAKRQRELQDAAEKEALEKMASGIPAPGSLGFLPQDDHQVAYPPMEPAVKEPRAKSSRPSSTSADLAERASMEVRALLMGGETLPEQTRELSSSQATASVASSAGGGTSSSMGSAAFGGSGGTPAVSSSAQPAATQAAALARVRPLGATLKGFIPRTTEPPKAKKDDDSVQKMLERLQGNVQQNQQTTKVGEAMQLKMTQMRVPGQVGLGAAILEAAQPMGLAFREETRTRADVEFEALMARIQAEQDSEEIDGLGREVLIRFPAFSPQQITDLLQKMGSATGLNHVDYQGEFSRMLIPRLKEFNSTQFTSLTSTFASWSTDARSKKTRGGGRFSEFSKAFFNAASAEMTSRLMEFAPHEVNCCLAAFVSVGFSEHKFFASVGRAALARHTSFAPVQLTALLAILSEMRLVHMDLFNASAQFLSVRAKELRPVDVIRVLRSFAKCGVHHRGMCQAVGDEVVLRVRDKSAPSGFKCEDLCEISWAFCVLQHYHEEFFRQMLRELRKSPTISTDALCQVYETHLVLDSEHRERYSRYRIEEDILVALQDHYKDNRKDERRCSERHRNDVASVLKSLVEGSVHVNHRTSTCLLVDVAALRKRSSVDGFVHVDLDSTITVVRALDQDEQSLTSVVTEGPVAMRRRLLAKHGLRLVTVRESEWRELDDSKDKRRYLRTLLSSLGDVLE